MLASPGPKQLRVFMLQDVNSRDVADRLSRGLVSNNTDDDLGVWAAEGIVAKQVGKASHLRPLLRAVAVATTGKMGAKWDFSPPVAADALLPPRLIAAIVSKMLELGSFIADRRKLLTGNGFLVEWNPAIGTTITVF